MMLNPIPSAVNPPWHQMLLLQPTVITINACLILAKIHTNIHTDRHILTRTLADT